MRLAAEIGKLFPYLNEGDRAYVVITPLTHNLFVEHRRPRPYFLLETKVSRVEGDLFERSYEFDTRYYVQAGFVFTSLDEAKKRLVEVFAQETDGVLAPDKIRVVSGQEEKELERMVNAQIASDMKGMFPSVV